MSDTDKHNQGIGQIDGKCSLFCILVKVTNKFITGLENACLKYFYLEYDDEDSSRSFDPDQHSDDPPKKSKINAKSDKDDDKSWEDDQSESAQNNDNEDNQNKKKSAMNNFIANNNFEQDKANESYEYSDDEEEIAVKARKPKESLLDDAKFRK